MKIRREEHMAGGNGHVIIKEILDAEQLNGKCVKYSRFFFLRDVHWDIMNIMEKVKPTIFYRDRANTMTTVPIVR